MTKKQREKAVLIAQDVLKLLRTKKNLEVKTGNAYINTEVELPEGESLQDHLKTLWSKPCEVCAKGALLLAKVDLFNKCKIPGNNGYETGEIGLNDGQWCTSNLTDIWPGEILDQMEKWFESGPQGDDESDADHLKSIMKNIIANNGEFTLVRDAAAKIETVEARIAELRCEAYELEESLEDMYDFRDF